MCSEPSHGPMQCFGALLLSNAMCLEPTYLSMQCFQIAPMLQCNLSGTPLSPYHSRDIYTVRLSSISTIR